jgi:hypothetical protein
MRTSARHYRCARNLGQHQISADVKSGVTTGLAPLR